MATKPVWHGSDFSTFPNATLDSLNGKSVAAGTFTSDADGATSVSDTNITANSTVIFTPRDETAGLLARTKTLYIDTVSAGSFIFHVSATAAGAPAGTEVFSYVAINEIVT